MTETVNQITPAYTYYLEANMKQIKRLAKTGTNADLIHFIEKVVEPAADTYTTKTGLVFNTKKARFLRTVRALALQDKDIVEYCVNSVSKARRTPAKYNNLLTK